MLVFYVMVVSKFMPFQYCIGTALFKDFTFHFDRLKARPSGKILPAPSVAA